MKRPLYQAIIFVLLEALFQWTGSPAPARNIAAQADADQAEARPMLITQSGHPDGVWALSMSRDGQWVVTGGTDNTARLWEAASGKEVRRFEGHTGQVNSIAISANNDWIITGGADHSARLWDTKTGALARVFAGHQDVLTAVAISDDGKWIATLSEDKSARVWEASTGAERLRLNAPGNNITGIGMSGDGRWLAGCSTDGVFRLWDLQSGKEHRSFSGHPSVSSLGISVDGLWIVTGGYDKTVRLWRADTGEQVRSFEGHTNLISSLAISQDNKWVVSGSADKTARLWDVSAGHESKKFGGFSTTVSSLAITSDGRWIVTGTHEDPPRLWDASDGRQSRVYEGQALSASCVATSADGRWIVTAGNGNTAQLWDVTMGKEVRRFTGHTRLINAVAISDDGRWVVTGSLDETARLWDAMTGEESRRFKGHSNWVVSVGITKDGQRIVTGSVDRTVRLWEAATGKEVRRFNEPMFITSVAISDDGRWVVVGNGSSTARLWDTKTGREAQRFTGHTSRIWSVAVSKDMKWVVTGSLDKTARLWEAATGREIRKFEGHSVWINSVAISTDCRRVLTGSRDKTAILWDVATGKQEYRIRGHSSSVMSVAFSSDARFLLTASEDGTTGLWRADNGAEICRLISFTDGSGAVVDPEGRFDASNLEDIQGLNWVFPQEPMRPLPIEIFMRQYLEPRLLPRAIAGEEFSPVLSLANLNRLQPQVRIKSIRQQPAAPDMVRVVVEVRNAERKVIQNGKEVFQQSGAYDLRMFRDGQLVGYEPVSDRQLRLDADGKAEAPFIVKLPLLSEYRGVEFAAYAFNRDGVKSVTDKKTFKPTIKLKPGESRAYVLSVGVNACENESWDLRFAVNDARRFQRVLAEQLAYSREYDKVIATSLISDYETNNGGKVRPRKLIENTATKGNFKAMLDLLAGSPVAAGQLAGVNGSERFTKATPNDLVMIVFSGHGYTDKRGNFYLLPYDTGGGSQGMEETIRSCISSEELSEWLKDIDAGEMVMIVDACHSAAAVEANGFKPGPMGSRGLGQMAYDKGMKILVASQADDVALEVEELKQGLLTYALVAEGLEGERADSKPKDRKIEMEEWLNYAVERVPKLYDEVKAGKVLSVITGRRDPIISIAVGGAADSLRRGAFFQEPFLFNFGKRQRSTLLARTRFR